MKKGETFSHVCTSVKGTRKLARAFVRALRRRSSAVVLFDAPMGAGKTTFTAECVKALGASVPVTSPTFSIINSYAENIFHVDLYRLEEVSELRNTDFYEIISGENFVFIEWAEKFDIQYPPGAIRVKITVGEGGERVFTVCQLLDKNVD